MIRERIEFETFTRRKEILLWYDVLVLVFIIAGLTSNLEGGVRGNRQEKEAFDQKPEEDTNGTGKSGRRDAGSDLIRISGFFL